MQAPHAQNSKELPAVLKTFSAQVMRVKKLESQIASINLLHQIEVKKANEGGGETTAVEIKIVFMSFTKRTKFSLVFSSPKW